MNQNLSFAALAAVAVGLSACSGTDPAVPGAVEDINEILLNEFGGTPIVEAELPPEATLSGWIAVVPVIVDDPEEDVVAIGELTLNANFDTGDITGEASDFTLYQVNGEASSEVKLVLESTNPIDTFTGTLDVVGDIVNVDEMTADLDGTLTDGSNSDTLVDATMAGDFFNTEDDDLAVGGVIAGTIDPEGDEPDEQPEDITGLFLAIED